MSAAEGVRAAAKAERTHLSVTDCYPRYVRYECGVTPAEIALTVILMACAYVYFALYFYHLIQALLKLRDLPRQDNKMASLQIRLQVHPAHLLCLQTEGWLAL